MPSIPSRLLSLSCATLLLTALGLAQDPPRSGPQREALTPERKAAIAALRQHQSPITAHEVVTTSAPERESEIPYELRKDPEPQTKAGVATGTRPLPAYLKDDPYRLAFVSGDYTPPAGERIGRHLRAAWQNAGETKHTYGFVMFQGRITEARRRRVTALGVTLYGFHTFQSYSARIPFAAIPRLLASPDVRWIGYARPGQKIAPDLSPLLGGADKVRTHMVVTVFESDMSARAQLRTISEGSETTDPRNISTRTTATLPMGHFQRQLEADGARVLNYIDPIRAFIVDAPLGAVAKFAAHDFVYAIERTGRDDHHHDQSTRQIAADAIRTSATTNGSSTVLGIIDSGAHMGSGGHVDLNKFGIGFDYLNSGGAFNDTNGHGTHVLGTMCGTGAGSIRHRGVAIGAGGTSTTQIYNAKAIPSSTGAGLTAIHGLRNAASTSPRPHVINNSWGKVGISPLGFPGTDATSRAMDYAVYASRQLHVVSNGNDGGPFGNDVLLSASIPAVAKNAFAVASCYDDQGIDGQAFNADMSIGLIGSTLASDTTLALPIDTSSTWPSVTLEGVNLRTTTSSNVTIDYWLYAADASGKPTGSPLRSGTATLGNHWSGFWNLGFPGYTYTPGSRLLFCVRPRESGKMRFPANASGGTFEPYYRKVGSGVWAGPYSNRLSYQPRFRREAGEILGYSAKGPTRDGRLKPNISAPGFWIDSCETKTSNQYVGKSGTSMAAPHVTGVAATLMHHYPALKYQPAPTKALLAATANPHRGYLTNSINSRSSIRRGGLGQVDAYKANWSRNVWNGWRSGWGSGSLSSANNGAYMDFTVSSDADSIMVCMTFDETNSSANAARAALADLDLYLDVEPFSSGYATGEYSSRAAWDTWEWLHITNPTVMANLRGKKVRLKIHPRVRPAATTPVHWGMAYCYYRGDQTPLTTATVTVPDAVKTGASFSAKLRVDVPQAVASNVTVALEPRNFDINNLRLRSPEGLMRNYSGARTGVLGNLGFWYLDAYRTADWTLVAPNSSGFHQLRMLMRTDNRSPILMQTLKSICVDGSNPNSVGTISSTTHPRNTWSNKGTLSVNWSAPSDNGCAGVLGIATTIGIGALSEPGTINLAATATSQNLSVSSNTQNQYFCARVYDKVQNRSTLRSYGPFKVDLSNPVLSSVTVNQGQNYTNSANLQVQCSASDQISGVAHVSYSAGTGWSTWRVYNTGAQTISLTSIGGNTNEGSKQVHARVRDKAGNVSSSRVDTIVLDTTKPSTPSVQLQGGKAHTNSPIISVVTSSSDALSGVGRMRYSENGTSWSAWVGYSTLPRNYTLSNTNHGSKQIYVQTEDRAGNVSNAGSSAIFFDLVKPRITLVEVAGGVAHINTLNTTVRVTASDQGSTVKDMRYSLNGRNWSAWTAYTTGTMSVDLAANGGNSNPGPRTVFVQVRDGAGNLSPTLSDGIVYDNVKPVVSTVLLAGGAAYTGSLSVAMAITAQDALSGVQEMRFSADGRGFGAWQTFQASTRVDLSAYGGGTKEGSKSMFVQVRDGAGNISASRADTVIYDATAPALRSLQLDGGATYTRDLILAVSLSASDASGLADMRFSIDQKSWTRWQSFAPSRTMLDLATLGTQATDGAKTLYAQVRDVAGNLSKSASDSITLDATAPVWTSFVLAGGAAYTRSLQVNATPSGQDVTSGLDGLRTSADGKTWSSWQPYPRGSLPVDLSQHGGNTLQGQKTLFAQLRDAAGNVSASARDLIIYDSLPPSLSTVLLAKGATHTSSLQVGVQLTSAGSPTQMRSSADGKTWSGWTGFAKSFTADLSQNGGSTGFGPKSLHVQLRDAAGNTSPARSDAITYLPTPVLSSLSVQQVEVVNHRVVTITGTGLSQVESARFGTTDLKPGSEDDWFGGYIRVLSDTRVELFTPQDLAPGSYPIKLRNAGFESKALNVQVVHNQVPTIGVPRRLKRGEVLHIVSHRGGLPATVLAELTFSTSAVPLVIPGIVSLQHGGDPTVFIHPTFFRVPVGLHNSPRKTLHLPLPIPASTPPLKVQFQTVFFGAGLPLPTSTLDALQLY